MGEESGPFEGESMKSWFDYAKEASAATGWLPTVIMAQWQLETGNFTSYNFKTNNNIAGQTWTPRMGLAMKGTARPKAEGGYYIRYSSPVDGYVDFIKKNPRYSKVKTILTEEGQIYEIARAGWAADKNYAKKLIAILYANRKKGIVLDMLNKDTANDLISKYLVPAYNAAKEKSDKKAMDRAHDQANELRKASGQPTT